MKTGYMILSAASLIPLLSGCATPQKSADSEAWGIKPTYNVRHSTETPDAYYQLGRYYQGQNRYDQAITAYQKALAIDGSFAEARNGLGVSYAMQGRQQESLEQFRLAVDLAPNAAHIHNNLGYALYLSGSYTEAASVLERAVALEPSNQSAHTNLALALDKAGDRGKAVQVMAQAASPQPVPLVTQDMPQGRTETSISPVAPVGATPAISAPALQQTLALPKDWGVITQPARKLVSPVESRIQAVQLSSNVYELRERPALQVQAASIVKPQQQGALQPVVRYIEPAKAPHQSIAATESLVQPVLSVAEQQGRAAATILKPYSIEVSNGNGVTGMARMVAGSLRGQGYEKARLTNQKGFSISSSQIRYRQGYQDEARLLMEKLPGQPALVQAEDMRKDIRVQIVLGKDMAGSVAYFGTDMKKVKLARVGSDS